MARGSLVGPPVAKVVTVGPENPDLGDAEELWFGNGELVEVGNLVIGGVSKRERSDERHLISIAGSCHCGRYMFVPNVAQF